MAGEADVWMNTEALSLISQFKTFPMQAISKQSIRHMRFADQEALMTLGMGAVTAYLALSIRDMAYGRERSTRERALAAVSYGNMTGFIPMVVDPTMTMLGLDNYRFNTYGSAWELSAPALDVANRAVQLPGALIKAGTGQELKGADTSAIKAIPFMNLPILSRMMYD